MKWTAEELESMAAWDAAIDAEGWTAADEAAARLIAKVLLPTLLDKLYLEKLSDIQVPEKSKTVYVKEKRPMRGKKKSKGNVAAQKARWYARQKLKKQLLSGAE